MSLHMHMMLDCVSRSINYNGRVHLCPTKHKAVLIPRLDTKVHSSSSSTSEFLRDYAERERPSRNQKPAVAF